VEHVESSLTRECGAGLRNTFLPIGRLRRQCSSAWKVEAERLFTLIVFNYVSGDGDAHLKNFSPLGTLFDNYSLSPAYDLLCTTLHIHTKNHTALDIFYDFITPSFETDAFTKRSNFLDLANRLGLRTPRVTLTPGPIRQRTTKG